MSQTPSLKSQQFRVTGMDCGSCAKTIEVGLQQLDGVAEVAVSFATEKVKVSYDTDRITEEAIFNRIQGLGYTVEQSNKIASVNSHHDHEHVHGDTCDHNHDHHGANHKHVHGDTCNHNLEHKQVNIAYAKTFSAKIHGMDCGSCASTVEVGLLQLAGVSNVSVSFATERLQLSYEPQLIQEEAICDRIKHLGYTVEQHSENNSHHHEHNQAQKNPKPPVKSDATNWQFFIYNRRGQSVILAGFGLFLGLIAQKLTLPIWIARAFYGVGIIIAGYPVARAGLFELRIRRADMNLLMSISVIGAIILGDWFEAALVVFLFSLGSTLQLFSIGRTRNAIRALMDLTPATVTVKRNGKEVTVPVESVEVNEIIAVRPGGRIALDGIVVSGTSAVDQSPITGESIPEDKEIGDTVYAGNNESNGIHGSKSYPCSE
jgi:Zn2+/Cd2+-exporting ATPase